MAIFDSHLHLARLPQPLEMARELHERGYRYKAVACEPWEWKAIDGIWAEASEAGWLDGCGRAYGIHPMIASKIVVDANPNLEETFAELRRLLENDPHAQVGEAGLDRRYTGYEPGGAQEKVFRRQAEMALELERDLQIHCVGDYGRVIKVLREAGFGAGDSAGVRAGAKQPRPDSSIKRPRPVFHRFGGDAGIVKAGLSLGGFFSIHADTLRKKATREALSLIPQANLLFETDADETFTETFTETFIATHGPKEATTPRDAAMMLEESLKGISTRFSPAPQRG